MCRPCLEASSLWRRSPCAMGNGRSQVLCHQCYLTVSPIIPTCYQYITVHLTTGHCHHSQIAIAKHFYLVSYILITVHTQVLEEGVVDPLLATMRRHGDKPGLLRHAAWLLSNLCRPTPQSDDLLVSVMHHNAGLNTILAVYFGTPRLVHAQIAIISMPTSHAACMPALCASKLRSKS